MSTTMEQAAEWLLRLREDNLTEEEMQQWLAWCESDPANLAAFEKTQSLWQSIPPELSAAFPRSRRGNMRWTRVALAATLAGALAIPLVLMQRGAETTTRIEAPARVNQNTRLPDGSRVALGAGSAVALRFSDTRRDLKMQNGTAFFRVAPDAARPFTVDAGPVSVTAVGTAFNVRRNAQRIVVTVEEGKVRVRREDDGNEEEVSAGQRLTYEADVRATRLESTNPAAELAWQKGQLVYDGEPLDVVIENVNRYASKKIQLADPAVGQLRFTGTVFVDSIDTWLGALPRAFPVVVESSGERELIAPQRE